MNAELVAQICNLTEEERIELIEEIWDSLPANRERQPGLQLSEAQTQELGLRMRAHLDDPSSAVSWNEAQRRIKNRFGFDL